MTVLSITVHGIPAPQGSKRHVGNGRMIEASRAVGPWREAVKAAAIDAITDRENEPGAKLWEPITGPVGIEVYFHFPRPRSHYGTGRNAGKMKLSAPLRPTGAPDLSKLIRSTEDALTDAGVWRDDALVISIVAGKYYDTHGFRGANITITENRRDLRLWQPVSGAGAIASLAGERISRSAKRWTCAGYAMSALPACHRCRK